MDERQETTETPVEDVEREEATGREVALATPVDAGSSAEPAEDEDEVGGGGNGRFITAIGAAVLLIGMFLAWYEVVRRNGYTENTTGWQTFTKLRFLLLFGSIACLASVLMRQTRPIVLGRLAVGLVASALVIRRIVSPPDLPGATITAQLGIYVSLLGGLGVAFGGLLGLGAAGEDEEEDAERAGDHEGQEGPPVAALEAGTAEGSVDEVVDADLVDDGSDADAAGVTR